MIAAEVLGHALLELAEQGRATPCQGRRRDRWTSDDAADREWAAHCCELCPVLAACRHVADERDERHHVWGGTDRTAPTRPRPANRPHPPGCEAVA